LRHAAWFAVQVCAIGLRAAGRFARESQHYAVKVALYAGIEDRVCPEADLQPPPDVGQAEACIGARRCFGVEGVFDRNGNSARGGTPRRAL